MDNLDAKCTVEKSLLFIKLSLYITGNEKQRRSKADLIYLNKEKPVITHLPQWHYVKQA